MKPTAVLDVNAPPTPAGELFSSPVPWVQRKRIRKACFVWRRWDEHPDKPKEPGHLAVVEAAGGEEVRRVIEEQDGFDGWADFGESWIIPRYDLDELARELRTKVISEDEYARRLNGPLTIEELLFTSEERWHAQVRQEAKVLGGERGLRSKDKIQPLKLNRAQRRILRSRKRSASKV